MFCIKCGTQLPDGSKFCNQCGADLSLGKNDETINNDKIIKQDKFKLIKSLLSWENGILSLCPHKLMWVGNLNFDIDISDIINVSLKETVGQGTLIINTKNDQQYKFLKQNMSTSALIILGGPILGALGDKKIADLEYWRLAIEKLRGN
ncbi:MAG: zinc-ribbon domain-containing protein [Bacteroidales bacterium]|jgi:hypothetical protein|nr:zinc-ribbon domain-containing protein [Bacteroidales bacterium]